MFNALFYLLFKFGKTWQRIYLLQIYLILIDFLKIQVLDVVFAQKIYKSSLLVNFSVLQKNNKNIKWKTNEFNQATFVKEWEGVLFCFFTKKDTEKDELMFTKLEILLKPHYFFNDNLHNANIFTVANCISTLLEIKDTFNLPTDELKILNIEYGINAISPINCKNLITYLLYHEKNQFITSNDKLKYSKISFKHDKKGNANNYKKIKFYNKGFQFPQFTDANTFRFEVKSKRTQFIKKLGIKTYTDLLSIEAYLILAESIQNEFSKVLIIDADNEMQNLSSKEKIKLYNYLNTITWNKYIQGSKNLFNKHKKIYFELLDKTQNNIHNDLKNIIGSKLKEILNRVPI